MCVCGQNGGCFKENYRHKEASGCNGIPVTYKPHTEEFPNEECLGQHRCPRISVFLGIHGDLPTQSRDELTFSDAHRSAHSPRLMLPLQRYSLQSKQEHASRWRDFLPLSRHTTARSPLLAASWVGEGRQDSSWGLAPYSKRSSVQLVLPCEQALNKGVTPSIVTAFT